MGKQRASNLQVASYMLYIHSPLYRMTRRLTRSHVLGATTLSLLGDRRAMSGTIRFLPTSGFLGRANQRSGIYLQENKVSSALDLLRYIRLSPQNNGSDDVDSFISCGAHYILWEMSSATYYHSGLDVLGEVPHRACALPVFTHSCAMPNRS